MPLPSPNLDDLTFDELVEEAKSLIPVYASSWTDHNPSDPGMMLVELLAWLTEMLLFRVDQVTDEYRRTFLRLLNEPGWNPSSDLAQDIRDAQITLRERHRAVTVEDYEYLSKNASEFLSKNVARAKCVPRRDLSVAAEEHRTTDRPSYVSVVIVPVLNQNDEPSLNQNDEPSMPTPTRELCKAVWKELDSRRLLTTRHKVVGPTYVPVSVEVEILATKATALGSTELSKGVLRENVIGALREYLHPLRGGRDGTGWPFGQNIYATDLVRQLESIDGVDEVQTLKLSTTFRPDPIIPGDQEEPIGIRLESHHLPHAQINPEEIVIETELTEESHIDRKSMAERTKVG